MNSPTVVIAANPVPSHPNVSLIQQVIESLSLLSLERGTKVILAHDRLKPSTSLAGTEESYNRYLARLEQYVSDCNASGLDFRIVVNDEWGHLTRTLRNAFRFVDTEFVLVLQHDLKFIQSVDLQAICDCMRKFRRVKHVRFNRRKNLPAGWDGDSFLSRWIFREFNFDGLKLCRTVNWSDQNHLATLDYYERIVFPDCDVNTKYSFMESALRGKTWRSPWRYGNYIYGAFGSDAVIQDLDGRNWKDQSVLSSRE